RRPARRRPGTAQRRAPLLAHPQRPRARRRAFSRGRGDAPGAVPAHARSGVTLRAPLLAHAEARSIRGSHGAAEGAEGLTAQRVAPFGVFALRRLRGVLRDPVMWWLAPGGSAFAG